MEFNKICNGMSYLIPLYRSKLYNGMLCFKPLNRSYCHYNKMVLSGTRLVGVSGQDAFCIARSALSVVYVLIQG
jgi:hypothetical protein